jgi:hypothetical protein
MEKLNLRKALTDNGAELDDKQIKFVESFEEALNKRMSENNETVSQSMKDSLKAIVGETPEGDETIVSQIRSIAESLDKLEKRTTKKMSDSLKFQLRKQVAEKHEDIVKAHRSGEDFRLEFRVAATMTNANTMTDAGTFIMPDTENFGVDGEITKIRYPENFILNIIRNSQVETPNETYIKKEQEPVEGAVAVVAEGGTKPLLQYQFVRTTTERVKYAGRIEWTEEFERDNTRLANEIIRMFENDVIRAWHDGVLGQMITNATAYTTSSLDGTLVKPDNGSAAIAAQSAIQQLNYEPTHVFMNPADVVANMFTQNTDGDWQLKPYMVNGSINGMQIVSSNKIAQGNALIIDSRIYDEDHSDYIFRLGRYSDQFITNEYTAIGEVFSLLKIAQLDLVGAMYIDLEAVKTSLKQI